MVKVKKSFDLCDFLQEQSFLEQMHRRGKRLIAKSGLYFTFEECKPDDYVYRMKCINLQEENDIDCITRFADTGWELAETVTQQSLFLFGTSFVWHYFCKKRSPDESENGLTPISDELRNCAAIAKRIDIEFVILIALTAAINLLRIFIPEPSIIHDFAYIMLTLGILGLTWRYLKINLGMQSKIKRLLSVYDDRTGC